MFCGILTNKPSCVLRSLEGFYNAISKRSELNIPKMLNTSSQPSKPQNNNSNRKLEKLHQSVMVYRHIYPEFLPDPSIQFRNVIREKLERNDMIARRTQVDIPEFYVGSILAVTTSDRHTPGKTLRFVGICIKRSGCGLRANFILRNVIDYQVVIIVVLVISLVSQVL